MKAERARLRRLHRLERVRAIAMQSAARASAEAETTLAQLDALAARTGDMVRDYAARGDVPDGASLRQLGGFMAGLQGIARTTEADALRARQIADVRLTTLASAERQRAVVQERAERQARAMANLGQSAPAGARRSLGTGLE